MSTEGIKNQGDSGVAERWGFGSDKAEFTGQMDGDAVSPAHTRLSPSVFWMY